MKNLTNTQLEILTNAFMDRVELKKEEMRQTAKYESIIEDVKNEYEYDKALKIVKKAQKIIDEINELQKEKDELTSKFHDLKISGYHYRIPKIDSLQDDIKRAADEKIGKYFPTKRDVQAKIILMSIKKSDDILQDLADEFAIEDKIDELDEKSKKDKS